MNAWLAMGGYGWYVWMSYGAVAVGIALELWSLCARRKALARLDPEPHQRPGAAGSAKEPS